MLHWFRRGSIGTLGRLLCLVVPWACAIAVVPAWGAAPGVATRDESGRWRVAAAQGATVAVTVGSNDEETTHALLADALSADAESL